MLERVGAGQPVIRCDWPPLSSRHATPIQGDLRLQGWAVSPAGVDSIAVEVAGHGSFTANHGCRRPDVHKAFYPARWARRAGFDAEIPTSGWLPGILDVTVTVRDLEGKAASHSGRLAWSPGRDELASAFAARRPALWVGEPRCDASAPLSDEISVRGWISAPDAVESVVVRLEGLEPAAAVVGERRYEPDDDLPKADFAIVLDARELEPGERVLAVRATTRGGSSTRSGSVVVDPLARHRRRLRTNATDDTPPHAARPGDALELHLFVVGGEPRDPLLASLAGQVRSHAGLTSVDDGLDEALEVLLEAPNRVGVFAAPTDSLAPGALSNVADCFTGSAPVDLVYSDHDTRDAGGDRGAPVLKPGWSPELLLSFAYVGSFFAIGQRAAETALRSDRPLHSPHALLLALADEPLDVVRIPKVLWTREADDFAEVSELEDVALHELAARRGARIAVTERDRHAGVRTVSWIVGDPPPVTIVMPTTGHEEPLGSCLRSLLDRTDYEGLDLVLVDSGGEAAATAENVGISADIVRYDGASFNFSRACNTGLEHARGDFVAFMNDDIEALEPDWLMRMVAQAQLQTIGVVGAKLTYPGGLVQHTGLFLDRLRSVPSVDFAAAQFAFHQDSDDPRRLMNLPRDCSAVTGACMLSRKEVLADLGGWDERFRIDFGDIDLCLRAIQGGRRVLVEPRARLLHHVHATQGHQPHDEDDGRRFLERWEKTYGDGDPWHHPACRFGRDWELP